MPTCYTSIIEEGDGCTFEQYLIRCANAFVRQHGENGFFTEIPKRAISVNAPYHEEKLHKATQALQELEAMIPEERTNAALAANAEAQRVDQEWRQQRTALRERYARMRQQVEQWRLKLLPQYVEFGKFMSKQIMESTQWDCGDLGPLPKPQTPEEWYTTKQLGLLKNIAYHTDELVKCREWEAETTAWLQGLRKLLHEDEEVEP